MQKKLPIKDGVKPIETKEITNELLKDNHLIIEGSNSSQEINEEQKFLTAIKRVEEKLDSDIFAYFGPIGLVGLEKIRELTKNPSRNNALLFMLTMGGDAHAAYKIAKRMQKKYKKFTLYVCAFCKSAGTLIAIGADSIIMSDCGELGPLDVQIVEKGEIKSSSSLSSMEPLELIKIHSYYHFINLFDSITKSSKYAPALANLKNPSESILNSVTNLTSTFIETSLSQINFPKLGEIARTFKIAIKYGEMLIENGRGSIKDKRLIIHLSSDYPSHSFVIDPDTASKIFKVDAPGKEEMELEELLLARLSLMARKPYEELIIDKLIG